MNRVRAMRRVGLVVLAVNLLLVVTKLLVWQQSGSLAVGSEAVNSLTDVGYSVVIVAGLYLTTQPPDSQHPHGHERIEPFVSLFVAVAIFVAGGLILWRALESLYTGDVAVATGPWAILVLAFAGATKFLLYRYCLRIGEVHNSPSIVATAMDNRNDVLTAGAALVGVAGAQAGYPLLDPIAATVVAIGIIYSGVDIVRDNVEYLVGGAPPEDLRQEIIHRAITHPEVEGVHDVIAHYVGPEIDVSLHVEVEGDHTLLEAHDIESDVVQRIQEVPEVDDVFVHVDPRELGEWKDDEAARLAESADEN
ncbi:cation diffusion facilitator family transporter [Halobacteria archaeon AArc-m2/3/4]|uniref:Cation diffusion facilitator family transporter n=1 Tax=Natronoglomus mannanivorans TaxID=2979990 RepID=A0ABT2QC86_9EURY|nr:cation diffusion facilitator family transporter [Halobacteria archaeon AArc-m2/3/4]